MKKLILPLIAGLLAGIVPVASHASGLINLNIQIANPQSGDRYKIYAYAEVPNSKMTSTVCSNIANPSGQTACMLEVDWGPEWVARVAVEGNTSAQQRWEGEVTVPVPHASGQDTETMNVTVRLNKTQVEGLSFDQFMNGLKKK